MLPWFQGELICSTWILLGFSYPLIHFSLDFLVVVPCFLFFFTAEGPPFFQPGVACPAVFLSPGPRGAARAFGGQLPQLGSS